MGVKARSCWALYATKPLFIVLLLGIASGLPLALTGASLGYRLADAKVSNGALGLFALVSIPYTLKFLWAPLLDHLAPPGALARLGRRRGWLVCCQAALALLLLALAALPLVTALHVFVAGLLAVGIAFFSASQDILIDAYRVELLAAQPRIFLGKNVEVQDWQGPGASMTQLGYRLGMLISGAGAMAIVSYQGWQVAYALMAAGMSAFLLVTLWADETRPIAPAPHSATQWLQTLVLAPFLDFTRRRRWGMIVLFILSYKLADAVIGVMTPPFYRALGFDYKVLVAMTKLYGLAATLLGIALGGALIARWSTKRVLFWGGIAHGLSNLLYVAQARAGKVVWLLGVGTVTENITNGIIITAFVTYLSRLCSLRHTATQYALLSSLAMVGHSWIAAFSGHAADRLGWELFFVSAAALAVPGLVLAAWMEEPGSGQPRAE